jgi:predicted nucleic acid-binding protein
MDWLTQLQGQIVGLDIAPLIYFIEENPNYINLVEPFFEALERREFTVITSIVTMIEVLVHPLRIGRVELATSYRDILLNQENLKTVEVCPTIAEQAAQLRAMYNLRTPDAIQIATALHEGASFFLTNDTRLLNIPYLTILVLDSLLES